MVPESKESACSMRNLYLSSGSGRYLGEKEVTHFQYSCLENAIDRGIWWATVHVVINSQTWLSLLYVNEYKMTIEIKYKHCMLKHMFD